MISGQDALKHVSREMHETEKKELHAGFDTSDRPVFGISKSAVDTLHVAAEARYLNFRSLSICLGARTILHSVAWEDKPKQVFVDLFTIFQAYVTERLVQAGIIARHAGRTTTNEQDLILTKTLDDVCGRAISQGPPAKRRRFKSAP